MSSSSRFPPSGGGDGRYPPPPPPRDRSPPSRFERRGSTQYDSAQLTRGGESSSYRPGDSYAGAPRDAPRAPKAVQDGASRGGYSSRGRGTYSTRSERESSYPRRREKDDWGSSAAEGDSWSQRRGSPVSSSGRARSRSPPPRDYRDKDSGTARSRDGTYTGSSAASDGGQSGGYFSRAGSYRGRGRSDYDSRTRGRGAMTDERDSYKARSRSRERYREYRDDRSRDGDRDNDRDGDRYRRDPPRPESRNSSGSQPPTPLTAAPSTSSITTDRWRESTKPSSTSGDPARRQSFAGAHDARSDFRSNIPTRPETAQSASPSSPQQTAQAGFGSRAATNPQPPSQAPQQSSGESPAFKSRAPDPILNAPKAPKAELQIPTGPRGSAPFSKRPVTGPTTPGHRHDSHHDIPGLQSPSLQRFGQSRPTSGPGFAPPSQPRNFGQWTSPTFSSRPGAQEGSIASSPSAYEPSTSPTGSHPGLPGKQVPTGPRAQQPSIRASMTRPTEPAAMAARRLSTQPKAPSIMRTMIPTKRDSVGEERPYGERRPSAGQSDREPRRSSSSILASRDHAPGLGSVYGEDGSKMEVEADMAADEDSTGTPDGSDEDDLNEEDNVEAEHSFMKAVKNLEAKRPPSPAHHPELMLLLEELNALGAAAEDLKNGVVPPPPEADEPIPSRPLLGLPSPTSDQAEKSKDEEDDLLAKLDEASVSEDLPVDGLPFLPKSRPLTPVSDVIFLDTGDRGDVKSAQVVLDALAREREDEDREWERMRECYATDFKRFRIMQEEMEDEKRREEDLKKAATPQPCAADDATKDSAPAAGRRRDRSAFSTQADENAAIQASKESYEKEQKEREERELLEAAEKEPLPDLTREAEIPDMYRKSERRADIFEDYNQLVEQRLVLEVFNFKPEPDDFNDEEQGAFIEAYCATPKKWGHIARELPGRDYKDCIRHYYLTKKEVQYKNIADRRRTKRGRGKRVAAGRPKASALLSDMPGGEGTPAADELTDAGRPKRAAAPVSFGENKKSLEAGKTAAGRRGAGTRASEAGDSASDKPSGRGTRGGRTAGARKEGARGGRGAKSTASATASGNTSSAEGGKPAPSSSLSAATAQKEPSRRSKSVERRTEEPPRPKEMESAQPPTTIPSKTTTQPGVPSTEPWRDTRTAPIAPAVGDGRAGAAAPPRPVETAPVDRPPPVQARSGGQGRGPGQVSSYWSVSEVDTFHHLIKHYGTDWAAIASLLTTKSQVMVKNYYQRQIEKGKNTELEQIAMEATRRNLEMGGPPSNPPINAPHQAQQPRPPRRVEPPPTQAIAPQTTSQRPLAPSSEAAEAEGDRAPTQSSPYAQPRAQHVSIRQAGAPVATEAARPASQEGRAIRAPVPAPPTQPGYYDRREPEPRAGQPLDQERFTTLLSAQHAQTHEAPHGVPPPPQREPLDPYAARQPLAATTHAAPPHSGRTPQMPLADLDRGTRAAPYAPKTEHSPPREPPYGQDRYRAPAPPLPYASSQPPPRPYSEVSRPSSIAQHTSSAPPPVAERPNPPAEKKRSNIMMMLNDDPPEPPKPAPPTDTRPPRPPSPRGPSPPTSRSMYTQPSQPAPPYSSRDHPVEPPRHHDAPPPRHIYGESGYSSQVPLSHQQSSIPPPPPADRRDAPSWTSSMGRPYYNEQPRHSYVTAAAASPQTQPSYLPPSRAVPPPRMESPPPSHRAHSRGSSYTGAHPSGAPPHTLAPHPYASIAPPPAPASQPAPPHAPPSGYSHHPPVHGSHQSHIPPPPYSQPPSSHPPGPPGSVQPPPPRGSSGGYMDSVRREEELRRYPSPGRQHYGYPPPPPPPSQRNDRGYERRYEDRR